MNPEKLQSLQGTCPCSTCVRQNSERGCPVGVDSCDSYREWFIPVWENVCAAIADAAGVDLNQLRVQSTLDNCMEVSE